MRQFFTRNFIIRFFVNRFFSKTNWLSSPYRIYGLTQLNTDSIAQAIGKIELPPQ